MTLKRDGVVLDLVPPPTKVSNLIFGRTWIDSPGEMVVTNLTTGDKVVLYFQPCGWFGYDHFPFPIVLVSSSTCIICMLAGSDNTIMSGAVFFCTMLLI